MMKLVSLWKILYSFDEEIDDAKDIKRKKLALKEQVANAKSHLDGLKSKYYAESQSWRTG